MPDTTIKKVEAGTAPRGEMGQKYLVAGKRVSMRLWVQEPGRKLKAPTSRGLRNCGVCNLGQRKARIGRTDYEPQGRRFMASASGSNAPIHDHRTLHGRGGDRAPGRDPGSGWPRLSRGIAVSERPGLSPISLC
jgi:hypothetical protein